MSQGRSSKDYIVPSTKNLKELFSAEREYVIPGYQRPYEWGTEKVDRLYQSIADLSESDGKYPLLIGTVQLNRNSSGTYEIIDGQQRLTTLWLLFNALGGNKAMGENSALRFSPHNEINKEYETDFTNAAENRDEPAAEKRYKENYGRLCELTCGFDDEKKNKMLGCILNDVLTVEIVTDLGDEQSVETIIQIFDSLNTSGLPLDRKDLFKIRFRDFLVKNNCCSHKSEEILQTINEAYQHIGCTQVFGCEYALDENDLIQAFRFFLISRNSSFAANHFSQGSIEFFFGSRKSNNKSAEGQLKSFAGEDLLSHFLRLARTMRSVQKCSLFMDMAESGSLRMRLCARELLKYSCYSSLCAIPYTLIYNRILGDGFEDAVREGSPASPFPALEEHILYALEVTELLWKYCSVIASVTQQVIHEVYYSAGNILRDSANGSSIEKIKDDLRSRLRDSERRSAINSVFPALFSRNGNVFYSRCRYLLVCLSYLEDCGNCEEKTTAREIKKQIFYKEKKEAWHQVEHIVSQKFDGHFSDEGSENYINSIGNLMLLEQTINSALGGRSSAKSSSSRFADFRIKRPDAPTSFKDYHTSELPCVKTLLKSTEGIDSEPKLDEFIKTRADKKRAFFVQLYSAPGGLLDPSLFTTDEADADSMV